MIRLSCFPLACLCLWVCLARPSIAADGLNLRAIGLTPNSRVVPGQVLILMALMENNGDQPAEGKVVVTSDELPGLQSVRHVMVQPGQSEQFDLIIPLPQELVESTHLNMVATLYIRDGDRQVISERNGEPIYSTVRLPITQGQIFGMAVETESPLLPDWYWPKTPPQLSYELAIAARIDAGMTRVSATYEKIQSLPLSQLQWNGLDLFIVAEPAALRDPAAVQAMCEYVASGGRIWVMLDKVPTTLLRPLLGAGQMCEEVDRVALNDFTVEIESNATPLSAADRFISSERDVPMTRVVQSGGRVTHHVDGWPVALTMDIGYGQLILTTLDSFVWIQPRTVQKSNSQIHQSNFETRMWATSFAVNSMVPRVDLPVSKPTDYPLRLIGNPVVPKVWVAIALLSFCGLLAGAGILLAYSERLHFVGLVAPCLAVVAGLAMLVAANRIRSDIAESVSRLQLVDVGDNGSFASIREQASVYLSNEANMQLESKVDGVMRSSEAVTVGVRRLVSEDFQKWHAANENWPPGAWRYDADYVVPTQGLVAKGRFSAEGLELSLPSGLPSVLEDPLLCYVPGNPLLCEVSAGGLRVNDQLTIDGERWITAAIMSDEQQRRLEVYQQFFEPNKLLHRPDSRLYGWTTPWSGSTWNHDLKQQGSALVSLPVVLERPAIGQKVFVPHGLIQLHRRSGSAGISSAFDDITGTWRDEVGIASQVDLEFNLPPEVVPLDLQAIDLALDATAPQRTVTISAITDAGSVEIVRLDSPSIPWKQTITDPAILKAFQGGRLPVSVNISNLSSEKDEFGASSIVTWHIDHFQAGVHGQLLPKSSLSKSP